MMKNRIKVLVLLLAISSSLIGQLPELERYKLYQGKVKKSVPKDKVYRLVLCSKDSIFPDSLLEYTNIKELHFKSCTNFITYENGPLNAIPDDICKLKNLISLKLPRHHIKTLPKCLSSLNIKYLDLSFNASISIDNLNCIDSLKYLILYYCRLNSIPQSIVRHSGLLSLVLADNNIKYIPENITKLKHLKVLLVSGNSLQEYSAIFSLENLTSLSLSDCDLDSIPSAISNLTKLKYLYIGNNNLNSIPSSISNLTKLKILNIRNNNIRKKEIRNLKKLLPNCEILY